MSPSSELEFNIHYPQPLLIVISGPSGAGKDTVMQRMKERGLPFHFVVTATTRPKRDNEEHGRDYLFISTEEFARMIDEDELIEHAIVYGDYKGIPKQQVREALASGMDVVMRLDVQGAETVRRAGARGIDDLHHHRKRGRAGASPRDPQNRDRQFACHPHCHCRARS